MSDEYGAFREDHSNLNTILRQLADELVQAEADLAAAEAEVTIRKNIVNDIATKRIPEVTDGLEGKFDLGDGRTLTIKEEIRASVAGDRLAPAVEWLDTNDYGGIVKRQLTIELAKGEDEKAKALKEALAPLLKQFGVVLKEKNAIHPQTLVAWVKERLKEGDEIPVDTFGIFRQQTAKVKE